MLTIIRKGEIHVVTDKEYIRAYIPLVDFLAELLGHNSEVALNDLTDLDHSIVVIRHSHISHRNVGDPASDLALRTMHAGDREQRDFICNYKGVSDDNRTLRSSTFYIRRDGRIIGMVCINTDDSELDTLQLLVSKVVKDYKNIDKGLKDIDSDMTEAATPEVEPEHLTTTIAEIAQKAIDKATATTGVSVEYLKRPDKITIVTDLYQQGFFQLKDAVSEVSKVMKISEPSVYRYLQSVKEAAEKAVSVSK